MTTTHELDSRANSTWYEMLDATEAFRAAKEAFDFENSRENSDLEYRAGERLEEAREAHANAARAVRAAR